MGVWNCCNDIQQFYSSWYHSTVKCMSLVLSCDLVLHMIKFYWVLLDITINLSVPLPFPGFTFLTGSCEYGTHITSWPASYIKFIYIKLALQLRAYSHYIENMYKADSQDEYIVTSATPGQILRHYVSIIETGPPCRSWGLELGPGKLFPMIYPLFYSFIPKISAYYFLKTAHYSKLFPKRN